MSGFEFMNMTNYGFKDGSATDFFPYCSHEVIAMMKNIGFIPTVAYIYRK